MYLDTCKVRANGKVYTRVLLRQSFRENGKVKHRTIANLSKCAPEEIAAIKLAFEHKHDLESLARTAAQRTDFTLRQGPSVGAVAVLQGLAGELGITAALGDERQGKLALWQVIARAIDQGSRLSAVRLATSHACCDLLGLDAFNEDHLYANLAWLSENQADIESRLKTGVFQMELFDQPLAEVCEPDVRYVLRRNPRRAEEMQATRQGKLDSLAGRADQANQYLTEHPRAKVATALKSLQKQIAKLKLASWVCVGQAEGRREIQLHMDEEERAEVAKLDGCYALKTDLTPAQADKETVHCRYKDLALVEQAFRISKTVELEMRPIHVRCVASTRGHALVVILAYILVRELARRWIDLDLTVGEGISQLATLCVTDIISDGKARCGIVPEPRPEVAELIALSGIQIPPIIRCHGAKAATQKKLPERRVKRS